jgi:hypothetical protein
MLAAHRPYVGVRGVMNHIPKSVAPAGPRERRFFLSRRNGDVTIIFEAEQATSSPASAAILVRKSNISHRPITHGNGKPVRSGCAPSTRKF